MCSTFWVFSSKIQMSREAQRIETGEKAGGTGLLPAGAVEEDPRKGTGEHRPLSTNPPPAFSGEAGTSRHCRMLPSRPGSSSPLGSPLHHQR